MNHFGSRLKSHSRRLLRDQRGGVAIVFALSLVPIIGLSGAAFDYANATSTRGRIGQAADAAALAAAKATNLTAAERARLARQVFDANTSNLAMSNVRVRVVDLPSGVRVEADADVGTYFLPVIGINSTNVGVRAEVARNDGYTEVALVLDTTGSMANDMAGMRTASANFVNTLFSFVNDPASMRVGVVPYVASVNAGRTNLGMSYVDSTAESPFHATILESRWAGWVSNCNPWYNPNPPPPGGGSYNPGPPGPGRGTPGRGVWLQDRFNKLAGIGRELFGVKPAAALGETPNTRAPLTGTMRTASPPYTPAPIQALVPTGFTWQAPCILVNPPRINHLDLFDRIPGARWAGCVEARPEPYDVTDEPPGADPRTRFVPYFWADERGARGENTGAANNYMNDGPLPANWTFGPSGDYQEQTNNILKYDGLNVATMTRDLGPNKACPDELMRLSSDKAALVSKINSLQATFGGGTITSEGAAWGWRVLSHKAPFADGRPPARNVKKFLVLMSDGENEIGDNPSVDALVSHYNAYGYLKNGGRFGAENYQVASSYLDNRLRLVCQNGQGRRPDGDDGVFP
jgi:Flp pilus assembly protein TadG